MATTQTVTDWRKEWFEIEDATYLNTAAHAAMPRVTLRAVQNSIEANKFRIIWTTPFSSKRQFGFGRPSRK